MKNRQETLCSGQRTIEKAGGGGRGGAGVRDREECDKCLK